jgi:hypothetical protein
MHRNRRTNLAAVAAAACLLAGCGQNGWVSRSWEDFRYDRGWISRGQAVQWAVSENPDERRLGIAILNHKGFDGLPRTEQYVRTLAVGETNPLVRGAAVRAQVHGGGDAEAVETLIRATGDADPYVRAEACTVLGELTDPSAIEPLTKVLTEDAVSDCRAAAARALAACKDRKAALALAGHVADEDFLVAYSCREGLIACTGRDLGYDPAAWRQWLEAAGDPFAEAGRRPAGPVKPEDRPGHGIRRALTFWKTDPREVVE